MLINVDSSRSLFLHGGESHLYVVDRCRICTCCSTRLVPPVVRLLFPICHQRETTASLWVALAPTDNAVASIRTTEQHDPYCIAVVRIVKRRGYVC